MFDSPWKNAIPAPRFSFMSLDLSTSCAYNLEKIGITCIQKKSSQIISGHNSICTHSSSRSSMAKAFTVRTLPRASSATPVAFATFSLTGPGCNS